jgi:hypothetical protein
VYPEITFETPGSFSNGGSMHQKHPPAKVARFKPPATADLFSSFSALNPLMDRNNTSTRELNMIKEIT